MRMRLLGSMALCTLLFTGLAACGGGDDDDASGDGEALELEDVPAGDGENNGGGDESDDGGDEETTTTTEGDDSGDDGPLLGDNLSEGCQTLTEALTGFGDVFTGGDIDVQEIAEAMSTIADNAPEEIAPEMAIIAEAYTALAEALDGVDINDPSTFQDPEIAQRLQEASQIFSTTEFTDAITAMSEFLTTECAGVPTG